VLFVPTVSAALWLGSPGVVRANTADAATAKVTSGKAVPGRVGELDCNGLSPIQRPVKPAIMCLDPRGSDEGRFYENGHYIGHDEPSVRFISSRPGSGSDTTFVERLPTDPTALPTVTNPGRDVTHWFELSVAPWFSTDVCDHNRLP
jgi:hypothetical protein